MIHLILGGARSGKSSYAEQLCATLQQQCEQTCAHSPIYIATAQAFDDAEMQVRIEKHQQDRMAKNNDITWQVIECPTELAQLLNKQNKNNESSNKIYLVDCLTLWLNNIIFNLGETAEQQQIDAQTEHLILSLCKYQHTKSQHLVLVANEVGLGVVPLGKVSRLFVDNAGWLNQRIAKIADTVTLITAGIPLTLKESNND
ncbi:bifunctional adenosylcobinamide kinase/adenosylcobinamide-phosphate guanylyltransferase [Thalassotalea psychrophila]|uniref:Bifunctional adenosylcobalamin biosynthesis protein n=1 Tax=Thalassotalea psychrophila TaxID=3065647 RepID=A0ABY9TPP8_9GAMM|nr:bifunctional adenosylcobinamide kinase/adenosylcobinamide-phosphate guanylyltransferase [Colwelliaceae bacterium SQ149]